MDAKKFYKHEKIYKYAQVGSGRFTAYRDAIDPESLRVFKFAATKGYLQSANDAPRGGKHGEHFEVLKYFTFDAMRNKMHAEDRRLNKALASVLETEPVDRFATVSDMGSFLIDGTAYDNYWGDGENIVEIVAADADKFKGAKFLSRREVFNKNAPITIVKFDEPRTIDVERSDCRTPGWGVRRIENALGFVIWERKAKIFVKK